MLRAESVNTVLLQTHLADVGPVLHGSVSWTVGSERRHGPRLAADGLAVTTPSGAVKADPLTTHARQLRQRPESLRARYALNAPGRPV
jgi:hypothetical protein